MSDWKPNESVGVLDFQSPHYGLQVRIRGVPETAVTYLLRPEDITNTLFILVLQALLRLDDLGLPYSTVFTRIHRNLPGRGDTQIGSLGINQPRALDEDDVHMEEVSTY